MVATTMGPLETYRRKRDLQTTPEPDGSTASARKGKRPIFVVQLHHARARHYDFRLEVDGVLKSWAVPKGPSLRVGEKRLAVEVEDHPLDYATFEGEIPQGHYGAGHVAIFDHGVWSASGEPLEALAAGKLDFVLHGHKLRGAWKLIRTAGKARTTQWLLLKRDDEFSADKEADDLLADAPPPSTSEKRKRPSRTDWRKRALRLDGARDSPATALPAPQLATLRAQPPSGAGWLHELKWDGYRMLARTHDGSAELRSRNGLDWSDDYPAIAHAINQLGVDGSMFDGELIALDAQGHSDFHALQQTIAGTLSAPLRYVIFDLLQLQGVDLQASRLLDRKTLLQALLASRADDSVLTYSAHVLDHADEFWRMTDEQGMEGIICKRVDAHYSSGRSPAWIKIKNIASDEFVVIGSSAPQGSREGFGALLLATQTKAGLRYVGRVGTGFGADVLREISAQLAPMQRTDTPVAIPKQARSSPATVTWYEPRLVVEVAFRGRSRDGLLRQASFMRVREDKTVQDIGETSDVPLSSPDKIVFPAARLTKQDVADYYREVAPLLLPEVARRPLALLRCPDGVASGCFFQKHQAGQLGDSVHSIAIVEKSGSTADYIYIEDARGLLELVQMNTLELHPWGARIADVERPDRLVLDLDPHEDVSWKEVIAAAREIRELLGQVGMESFVRLSGGKGVHVVIPVEPVADWAQAKQFCEGFAKALAAHAPRRYVAVAAKNQRKGRIFIDWLRNGRGATSIASWSLRAREGAAVAMPLRWSELGRSRSSVDYPLPRALRRARSLQGDPWEGWDKAAGQRLVDLSVQS